MVLCKNYDSPPQILDFAARIQFISKTFISKTFSSENRFSIKLFPSNDSYLLQLLHLSERQTLWLSKKVYD